MTNGQSTAQRIKAGLAGRREARAEQKAIDKANRQVVQSVGKAQRERRAKPLLPVDQLATLFPGRPERLHSFTRRDSLADALDVSTVEIFKNPAERMAARPQAVIHKPAEAPPRGAGEIVAKLNRRGITFELTADRKHLCVMTTAGGLDEPTRNAVAAAAPLLLAYLAGDPLRCIVTAHDGQAPEAVTILLGGAPWCGECRP